MNRRSLPPALGGGLAFTTIAITLHKDALAAARLSVLGAALGAIVVSDLAERRIPNNVLVPATLVCAGLSLAEGISAGGLASALAIVAVLLVLSLARPAALGMGDVKLALLLAAGLDGAATTALMIGLALAAGAGIALILRYGRAAGRRAVPLAPFLAAGALLALLS